MKKKVIIISTIVIILILCIILGAIVKINSKTKSQDLVFGVYNKMIESSQYSFLMSNEGSDYKTTFYRKNEKTMIDMYSNGSHNSILIQNGTTCSIMHDLSEYHYYDSDGIDTGILTDELYSLQGKEYTTGNEKINTIKYEYEEFIGFSAFVTNISKDTNTEEIKTRFYFDKNDNLVYIKTITNEDEELLKIELSYEVDDSIFEIPSNYAEN